MSPCHLTAVVLTPPLVSTALGVPDSTLGLAYQGEEGDLAHNSCGLWYGEQLKALMERCLNELLRGNLMLCGSVFRILIK